MAQKRRFLDVWIVESNTVYREVPYTVVVDWIQQGRLLEDDMLRWSGQKDWFRLGGTPAFTAFLPRSDPYSAGDQAEALEAVHVDFSWKRRPEDEDDDIDMIPLIDVSLVLLVFFMMTAIPAAALYINMPAANNSWITEDPDLAWVGLDYKRDRDNRPDHGTLIYAVGQAEQLIDKWEEPDTEAGRREGLSHVRDALEKMSGQVEVNIQADQDMPEGYVRDLTVMLEGIRAKVTKKYVGVSEKVNP
jgi:Biopolymer transport protein ExbD/TolR